jgi:hypothetical protein
MDLIRGQCLSRLALSYDINVYGLSNFVFSFPQANIIDRGCDFIHE